MLKQTDILAILFILLLLAITTETASCKVMLVDFNGYSSGDPSDNAAATYAQPGLLGDGVWNGLQVYSSTPNVISEYHPSGTMSDLVYADGSDATGISIDLSGFTGADWYGGGIGGLLYADYIGISTPTATITINGLVPGQPYDLAGYGSNGLDGVGALWTVDGSGPLDLSRGTADSGILYGIVADGSGTIAIELTEDPYMGLGLLIVNGLELSPNESSNGNPDCPVRLHQDLNYDCKVDLADYGLFAQTWLGSAAELADFADGWLKCTDLNEPDCIATTERLMADEWLEAHFTGANPAVPFSFVYNGVSSESFLSSWPFLRTKEVLDADRVKWTLQYTQPDGGPLQINCYVTEYLDHPAVEWVIYFENIGGVNTSILKDVDALKMTASCDGAQYGQQDFTLHYSRGSVAAASDFEPMAATLGTIGSLSLAPNSGRSSDGIMPFFNIAKPDGTGNIFAIGWSGQWNADFNMAASCNLKVAAGMEQTHLRLYPGEEQIRTPAILLSFWAGDYLASQNKFRKLMLDHYSPRPGGNQIEPIIAASVHGTYSFEGTNESNMVSFVAAMANAALPVDYMWIDAGWYDLNGTTSWVNVGTWEPDPMRYPNGMAPLANYARSFGYKFLLWFEPERVTSGSWLWENHPEWIFMGGTGWKLLNMGNPDALAWAKNKFSGMVNDIGIDIYRHDFNVFPLTKWRSGEAIDRQGINEIRHIMGLYEYFDYLLSQNPDLIIDNCASGGRRIDFEMQRRSVPLWRSDLCWDPLSEQSMMYGLSYWIPVTGVGSISLNNYDFRSGMGGTFSLATNKSTFYSAVAPINQLRSVANYYMGDYYPLTPYSYEDNTWMAWQFDREDLGKGLVQAFRRTNSTNGNITLRLQGLIPQANYVVKNVDVPGTTTKTGSELMTSGLIINIATAPGSVLITYTRQ